jgi:predicted ATPase
MPHIKVKNFGPIKTGYTQENDFIDISKVTVFIGNQGSGKSTIAKLISTFSWMEKALIRGDYTENTFTAGDFLDERLPYHKIEDYIQDDTEIEYVGDAYSFKYKNKLIETKRNKNSSYALPQIMYVPAERNIISIEGVGKLKGISGALSDFIFEYSNASGTLKEPIELPINGLKMEYDKIEKTVFIAGKNHKIRLSHAASGFQSFVPLFLVSRYFSNYIGVKNGTSMSSEEKQRYSELITKIYADHSMNDEQKRINISDITRKFNKTFFVNIIEEPEQNLFPTSQQQALANLLAFNNAVSQNKLIITTHSPYLINFLTLAIEVGKVEKLCKTDKQKKKLFQIFPWKESIVNPDDLRIYELDDKGTVHLLKPYDGYLPSDENKLNFFLGESNDIFSHLMEMEQSAWR